MSQSIQIACPQCGMQYAITNPQFIGQTVPCSRCRQPFMARPLAAPGFPMAQGGYGMPQPAFQQYSPPAIGGQSPFAQPATPSRNKGSNTGLLVGGLVGGGLLAVAVMVLVGWLVFGRSGNRTVTTANPAAGSPSVTASSGSTGTAGTASSVPPVINSSTPAETTQVPVVEGIKPSGLNPFADTPTKVANDAVASTREMIAIMRSIQDAATRDAAIQKLSALAGQFDEQVVRASQFAPLSDAELKSLIESTNQQMRPLAEEAGQISMQLQNSPLVNAELIGTVGPVNARSTAVMQAIDPGLRELPAADYEGVKHARELVLQLRSSLQIVSRIQGADDYPQAIEALKKQSEAMRSLIDNLKSISSKDASELRSYGGEYTRFRIAARRQLDAVADYKIARHGSHADLEAVLRGLGEQDSRYSHAAATAGQGGSNGAASGVASNTPPHTPGQPGSNNPMPIAGSGSSSTAPGFPPGFSPGGQPPGNPPGIPPGFPGGPPLPGQGAPGGSFDIIDIFTKQHGEANVVTIGMPRQEPKKAQDILAQLSKLADTKNTASSTDARTTILLQYKGDVQALADKIDFAKVISVDAMKRKIELVLK